VRAQTFYALACFEDDLAATWRERKRRAAQSKV
jgi:hypothetical protein